jgi:hypothetical protein
MPPDAASYYERDNPHANAHFRRGWVDGPRDLLEARRLDRLADLALANGRAGEAEILSWHAFDLRGGGA